MAGKQLSGDGLASNLAGMSKAQLYDIMCQMKSLIEQNQHQAKQILVQNPLLTRALFQAQIMLGMVQPSQAVPSVQPQSSQQPSPHIKQSNAPVTHSTPSQVSLQEQDQDQDQANFSRKQQQNYPPTPISSTPLQGNISQPIPLQPIDLSAGHMITQATQMHHPKSSQVPNMPSLSLHSGSFPPSIHQPPLPPISGHLQPPLQTTGISHHMLQPPLPPQPRHTMQMQFQPQVNSNVNYQNSGNTQVHHSQPMFHTGSRPSGGIGPYPPGQPPLPNQPPYQPIYQGAGSHLGNDYSNQGGSTMQMDRGSAWSHTSRENPHGAQLPTLQPLGPGPPMPVGNQPRPPPLTPVAEQELIQQVMSLTPDQINQLQPDQRLQVLQLQQMLRRQ